VATAPVVKRLRLVLDSAGVAGWNEIDAVQLIGDPWGETAAQPNEK
jgi:hypothetical protein